MTEGAPGERANRANRASGTSRAGRASRAGRRPGQPDTRAMIVDAARLQFAEKGFDGTSIRAVARAAQVDSALVHHYFESKEDLMLAALALPIDPREFVPDLLSRGLDELPERLAQLFLRVWEDEAQRLPLTAMVKAAITSEGAADVLRTGWARMIVEPLAAAIGTSDGRVRAEMVASQLVGMAIARYILRIEPLASTPVTDIEPRLASTIRQALGGTGRT
jgi:AcrR family transcriptional regulator